MKLRTIVTCWFLVAMISGCNETETPSPRREVANDLPSTDQALAELARKVLLSEKKWTHPVKTDPVTRDSNPVSLFASPPPEPDEELTFRSEFDGNSLVTFVNRYGTIWKASVAVFDGETETAVFEGDSLSDCLSNIREAYNFDSPLVRIWPDD